MTIGTDIIKTGPIPDTICKCTIDGHEVTAIYHSDIISDRWDSKEWPGSVFEVECEDEATRQKVLAAWKHEEDIDAEEIKAGRRDNHTTWEGIMEWMLGKLAGGRDKVEVVQHPDLFEYGYVF